MFKTIVLGCVLGATQARMDPSREEAGCCQQSATNNLCAPTEYSGGKCRKIYDRREVKCPRSRQYFNKDAKYDPRSGRCIPKVPVATEEAGCCQQSATNNNCAPTEYFGGKCTKIYDRRDVKCTNSRQVFNRNAIYDPRSGKCLQKVPAHTGAPVGTIGFGTGSAAGSGYTGGAPVGSVGNGTVSATGTGYTGGAPVGTIGSGTGSASGSGYTGGAPVGTIGSGTDSATGSSYTGGVPVGSGTGTAVGTGSVAGNGCCKVIGTGNKWRMCTSYGYWVNTLFSNNQDRCVLPSGVDIGCTNVQWVTGAHYNASSRNCEFI